MKTITLLSLLFSFNAFAGIVVKDIPDFSFSQPFTSLGFDFNSDGTDEFTFNNMSGGIVGAFFDASSVNFVTTGSQASGHGWDVIKYLSSNISIGSTSNFAAAADAYINPNWAYASEYFPSGDSYIGTTFKIGTNRYYGWILIHSTGTAAGVITIKSYAYNDTPNQSISAGQTLDTDTFRVSKYKVFPNPVSDSFNIENNLVTPELTVTISNTNGQIMFIMENGLYNISQLSPGVYFLRIEDKQGNFGIEKIIKN